MELHSDIISKVHAPVKDLLRWIEAIDKGGFNAMQSQFAEKMHQSAEELLTLLEIQAANSIAYNAESLNPLRDDINRLLQSIRIYDVALLAGAVGPLESEAIQRLNHVEQAANYTLALTDDLFGYSAATLGRFPPLIPLKFDVHRLIHEFAMRKLFDIDVDIDPQLPFAYGEYSRTKGLITKILMMLEATSATVSIKAYARENHIEIMIARQSRIFTAAEIFELGTKLLPEIAFAEWQQGNLRFENELCATFYLTLPKDMSHGIQPV